ncbi:octaprenyl pyrophosphate synthase, putative [Plasmodium gallinaceum]|uniref:Octaprenyl pyrophosphate synthase, putative n=1 Tax=Plasmodium gallinaceum TaxID=5849 RepID=A0A1J1GT28_PLAGA|nr:octaprenyl pyrophosphate synthase, putative [Plasmodium gallinaceum]CRG95446.1 octaprenyl pyrophosphate synthase, putative [Plasmodium gallinaceum]
MILLSKNNVKGFLNYCNTKCYNSLINKNDNIFKKNVFKNNIYYVKKASSVFKELIKESFNKFKQEYLNNKTPNINKALKFCENSNMIFTESLYKEILMCMNVLHYKDQEVDNELNYLHEYFKSKKSDIDPFTLCENKIKIVDEYIYNIIKTNYSNIDEFTSYIYLCKGKKFRIISGIFLKNILSYVDNMLTKSNLKYQNLLKNKAKSPINKSLISKRRALMNSGNRISKEQIDENQYKIIAAAEIIHMGSLLHDDVIDESSQRRGILSLHKKYGNKVSILSGDFLIARAGSVFADTNIPNICKRFACVIESLIKGEFLQTNLRFDNIEDAFKIYLIKSYHKTASLFSHLFASIAVLSFKNEKIIQLCFNLGLHIGMAFQLYDDYLDYKIDNNSKKPILDDVKNNIKTAPLFFSYNYNPDVILSLINKKSFSDNDINNILTYIKSTNSMKKNELCSLLHIKKAFDILSLLVSNCKTMNINEKKKINEYEEGLINIILNVLSRSIK